MESTRITGAMAGKPVTGEQRSVGSLVPESEASWRLPGWRKSLSFLGPTYSCITKKETLEDRADDN